MKWSVFGHLVTTVISPLKRCEQDPIWLQHNLRPKVNGGYIHQTWYPRLQDCLHHRRQLLEREVHPNTLVCANTKGEIA